MQALLYLIFMLTLLLGACSEPDVEGVLPAEDVIEGDITVLPDPAGTGVTLEVTTSIDMACAIVYGDTPDLGDGVATDTDMAGGAHADHAPRLTGLQPDTEYYYRIQGSGADGSLYQSDLMTFRTPAAEETEGPGENIAPEGEVVDFSSEFSDTFKAGHAIDGDRATEWSTAGDGNDASITIDLGEPVEVVGLGFQTRAMGDGSATINSYTVTVDGDETLGPFPAGPGLGVVEQTFTGQILRFDAKETTGGNTGASEIEIYR